MSHFSPGFTTFFKDLKSNNSTAWFNDNRKSYEKEVKKPFAAFVDLMIDKIRHYEPEIAIKASDAIGRINKDIRFSKDKTPYNTFVAANISRFGKKDKSYPGFYFQLSDDSISVYGGAYMLDTSTLSKVRKYISENLTEFQEAYKNQAFKKHFGAIQGEVNKRIPEEFQPVFKIEPLIANKQFFFSAKIDAGLITDPSLPEKLMEYYQASMPVNEFLREAVKS